MVNLMKRDFYVQKTLAYFFIPMILLFLYVNLSPLLIFTFAVIYVPFNAIVYDATVSTHMLLNSLPYKRSDIIHARFISTFVYGAFGIAVTAIILAIFQYSFTWKEIVMSLLTALFFATISYPIMYAVESRYLPVIFLIAMGMILVIAEPVVQYALQVIPDLLEMSIAYSGTALLLVATGVIGVMYACSWLLTIHLYKRRVI